MAEFGRRRAVHESRPEGRPTIASARPAAAAARTGALPRWAKVGPLRFVLMLLFAAGAPCVLAHLYGGDLLRDHRLAGTWQPAYDMRVVEGRCTRHQFTLTFCDATIRSRVEPGRVPLAISYMMAFSSGGGEPLVPIRSTVDPAAVTIAYAAETQLINRTLTFLAVVGGCAAVALAALRMLLRGQYAGGAAHRALLAGWGEVEARAGTAHVGPRAIV